MKAKNRTKKTAENGRVRVTISVADDLHPKHSEAVRERMTQRRSASYSNLIEVLIAEDLGLKQREAVPV